METIGQTNQVRRDGMHMVWGLSADIPKETNQVRRDGMVWCLSAHYILVIKPEQLCHCFDCLETFLFQIHIVRMQGMPIS